MDKICFETIYENYGEHTYPKETADSVRRCHVPYEKQEQAYKDAVPLRKLTKQQASADVIDFFNCLKRTYSGYDYFFTDEKCDEIREAILRKIKSRLGKISNKTLALFLFRELYPILNDCHFNMYVCKREQFFRKNYSAYVTDIVLRKADDIYEIVNENPDIPKGSFFTENEVREFLLPTLYVGENCNVADEYYLLGKYSLAKVNALSIKGKKLRTHRILCDSVTQIDKARILQKDGYVIVNHSSYGMPWNDEELLQEYYNDGYNCAKSDAVILNLAGNGGGSSFYPERFYEGLNGHSNDGLRGAYLPFPTELPDEVKSYQMRYPNEHVVSTYHGTLYVVMNKSTASSAEMGVSPSYYVNNAVRVGSGTFGCTTFGNCFFYQLPNSKICLSYGSRLFYYENFEEGKGFLPDYWIDDKDPVGVVEEYIKKKATFKETHGSRN